MQIKELIKELNCFAPFKLCESYDNVGLLVGDMEAKMTGVLCALDISDKVIDEAISLNANVIIAHHPIIFNKIGRINKGDIRSDLIIKAIKNDINCIALHTNADKCGLNEYVAKMLGIKTSKTLEVMEKIYSLSFYVPKDSKEKVLNALFEKGAGKLFNYSDCAFTIEGKGQFKPQKGATPFIGEQGKTTELIEEKVELIVEERYKREVISALITNHPYEQVAYNLIKSENQGQTGFGVVGELKQEMTLKDFCEKVKEKLGMPIINFVGDKDKVIKKVALCTGSGGGLYSLAASIGADAYLTGDIKHDIAIDALMCDTALIDMGHYYSEAPFKNMMYEYLQVMKNELQCNLYVSKSEEPPFNVI